MNHGSEPSHAPRVTPKQGQYLSFTRAYTLVLGRSPAEADLQQHFRVAPRSVHQRLITLEQLSLIRCRPRVAHSIELLIDPATLPRHCPADSNRAKPLRRSTS
jgi:hypothetical protein